MEKLPVGAGQIDLSAYLHGNLAGYSAGVQVGAEKRVSTNLSVFGQGWAGTNWSRDTGYDLDYGALGGLRWRF